MSAGLATSTVTPGSTAPDASRTRPAMLLVCCADAAPARTCMKVKTTTFASNPVLRIMMFLVSRPLRANDATCLTEAGGEGGRSISTKGFVHARLLHANDDRSLQRRIQSPRRRGAGNAAHRGHGVREHLAAARWPPDRGKGRRRRVLARVVRAEPGRALRRRRGDRRRRSRGGPLGVPQGAEWPAMAPSRRRRLQRARRESRGEAGVCEGLIKSQTQIPNPKSQQEGTSHRGTETQRKF